MPSGVTVLEAAHMNEAAGLSEVTRNRCFRIYAEVDLEGACEASLACSTCHVILNTDHESDTASCDTCRCRSMPVQDTYESCGEPTEKEEDTRLLHLLPTTTMPVHEFLLRTCWTLHRV